jgi:hypothetical protein
MWLGRVSGVISGWRRGMTSRPHLSVKGREIGDTGSGKEGRWAAGRKRGWAESLPRAHFYFFHLFFFLFLLSFITFAFEFQFDSNQFLKFSKFQGSISNQ